jgi:hypothetical protein
MAATLDPLPLSTSFSSVPTALIEAVRDVATREGVRILRPIYETAVNELCDDLDAGLVIETWPSARPGGAKAKRTVKMMPEITARMNRAVKHHHIGKGVFFRVALIRWLARRGVEYPL